MSGKKVLVTGSGGLLGSHLVNEIPNSIGYSSQELDITKTQHVNQIVEKEKPDIIIHAAAFTDVEACEIEVDKAFEVNTIGTQNLVNCCIDRDILFVFISSTGIYGSHKTERYIEFDKVEPSTIHHSSKYEAEKVVTNHLKKYLILRTGWIFGGNSLHKKNFVYQRYAEAKNNALIYSDASQIGNPTYVLDLVEQIKTLISNNQFGTYNCVNDANNISRYDYVKKIVELFDLACKVEVAPKDMFIRNASVSSNESALNFKLNLMGINRMRRWDEALEDYINKVRRDFDSNL
jgi:dTDP-4-dehydrorhamnose reductase